MRGRKGTTILDFSKNFFLGANSAQNSKGFRFFDDLNDSWGDFENSRNQKGRAILYLS